MVSGTPSATVVDEPKLERMSLRTMPESSSTLMPFDPSPGYGPAVSSGTSVTGPDAAADALAEGVAVAVADAAPVALADVPGAADEQAASSAVSPTPPKMPSATRRSTSVRMS